MSLKQANLPEKKPLFNDVFAKPQQDFKQTTVEENITYTEKILKPLSVFDAVEDVTTDYEPDFDDDPLKIEFPVSIPETKIETQEPITTETATPTEENTIRFVGEAYKTYIFIELNGKLCVIDKHAAHERILFNKLKSQAQNSGSQMLLAPVTVTLGKEEYIAVTENLETIAKSGFDIEDFGNGTVIIRSCPMDLDNQEIAPLISEIAEYLTKNRRDITNEHLDWIYHNVACRSAIKAGDDNFEAELLALAKQVVNDNGVRFCPHGRPVMIEISKYELEKQFGRV